MTAIDPKGGLAIAEIVFFAPALLVSIFIVLRHGFARQMGWVYLVILSLLRLIGNSALLYSETQHDYSTSLLETIYITSAVGTAPLLLALLGFMARVHDGMKAYGTNIHDLVFRGISLISIAALVLAIVGGVNSTGNPSEISTGHALSKAASVLFLAIYIVLAAITIFTYIRKSSVLAGERKLVDAGIASLPFLLVRIAYTVAASFSSSDPGSVFYPRNVNVYVSAFMQFLMEALIVVIFMVAGLLTPKREKKVVSDVEFRANQSGREDAGYENVSAAGAPHASHAQQPQRQTYNRPQRNLWDYRPSKLIGDAIRGR